MKITYINHSGFLLETEEASFLFDYYQGQIPRMEKEKEIVVFVSHKHSDHYNPEIFSLAEQYPRVQFVVSKDVPAKWQIQKYKEQGIDLAKRVLVVRKNEKYELLLGNEKTVQIETLKSTDEGVAYLLTCEGKCYYHAGDLNLWVWGGESKQYNDNMTKAYYRELEKLKGKELELAFVPLDPRQEKDAFSGLKSFLEYTKCRKVFPMHCWGKYDLIEQFLAKYPEYREQVLSIKKEGQTYCF